MANVPRNVTGNSEQPVRNIWKWKIPKIPHVSTPVHPRNPHQNLEQQSNSNFKQPASIPGQVVEHQFSGGRSDNCYLFYQFWKPEVPRSLGQVWTVRQCQIYPERVYFQNNYNGQITWKCPLTEDELIEYFKKQDDRRWEKIVAEQQEKSDEASNVDPVNLDKSVVSTYIKAPNISRNVGSTSMGIQQQKEIVTNYDEEPMRSNPGSLNMLFDNADILDREIEMNNLKRSDLESMNEDDVDEYYSNNSERFNINNNVPHTSTEPVFNHALGQNERWNSYVTEDIETDEDYFGSSVYSTIVWKPNYIYADDESLSTNLNEFNVATDGQNMFEKNIEKETSLTNVLTEEESTPEETKSETSEKSSDAKSLDNSLEMMPENDVYEHYEEEKDLSDDGALEEGNRKNNDKDAFGQPVLKGILKSNSALRNQERLIHSYVDEEEGWINMKIVTDTRYFTTRTVTLNNDIDLKNNAEKVFENPESSDSSSDDEEISLTRNQTIVFRKKLIPELIESFCSILTKVIEVGMEKVFKENWENQCKLKQPWEIDDCLMILQNNWNIIGKNEETNNRIKEIRLLFEHFGRGDELIIPEIMLALHFCKHLLRLLSAKYENLIHPFMRYFGAYEREVKKTLARRETFKANKNDKRRIVVCEEDENKEEEFATNADFDAPVEILRETEKSWRNQDLLEETTLFMIEDIKSFCENSSGVLNIGLYTAVYNEDENFLLRDVYEKFQFYSVLVDKLQDVFKRIEASPNEDLDENNIGVIGFLECLEIFRTEPRYYLTVETVREYFSYPLILRYLLRDNWIPRLKLYRDMLNEISTKLE